jgi:hypothetical protein
MAGDEQINTSPMPVTVSGSNHEAQGASLADRIFYEVPFEQNEAAKAAGLRWDSTIRKWYAATSEIAQAFSCSAQCEQAAPAQAARFYFKVPFLQKDRAKAMGMRFDGIRKLWFAPNQALAVDAARIFERMTEVLDNAGQQ